MPDSPFYPVECCSWSTDPYVNLRYRSLPISVHSSNSGTDQTVEPRVVASYLAFKSRVLNGIRNLLGKLSLSTT